MKIQSEVIYEIAFGDSEENSQTKTFVDGNEADECFEQMKSVTAFPYVIMSRITHTTIVDVLGRKSKNV